MLSVLVRVCVFMCVYVILSGIKEEDPDPRECRRNSSGEETALLLPEPADTFLRYSFPL